MESYWQALTHLLNDLFPTDLVLVTLKFLKIGIVSIEAVELFLLNERKDPEKDGEELFQGIEIRLSDETSVQCLISAFDFGRGFWGYQVLVPPEMEVQDFVGAYLIAPIHICDETLRPVKLTHDYVGAYLIDSIHISDETLRPILYSSDSESETESEEDPISIKAIRLLTNKGYLEQVVFNCHNGHYGHDVVIKQHMLADQWDVI